MTKTLTRVYSDYPSAAAAVQQLKAAGLSDSAISIVASDAEGWHKPGSSDVDPRHDKDRDGRDDRSEGAAAGGAIGAVAGGAVGVATGLGLIAIPGVGPVVAAGWLAALAVGAVAGGASGGIIGALVSSGTSKENAELYAETVRRGGAIVTAKVPDDQDVRFAALLDSGAINMVDREAAYRKAGWKTFDPNAPVYTPEQVRAERDLYR